MIKYDLVENLDYGYLLKIINFIVSYIPVFFLYCNTAIPTLDYIKDDKYYMNIPAILRVPGSWTLDSLTFW